MIHSSSQGLYHSLHLQFEEKGGEPVYRQSRGYRKHVHLLVVVLGESVDYCLCVALHFEEETPLYTVLLGCGELCVSLPSHVADE